MGKILKASSNSVAPDIRVQMEESLETLKPLISQASNSIEIQKGHVSSWTARVSRAKNVLGRVKPEGKQPTEILLAQAEECLLNHEAKLEQSYVTFCGLRAHEAELKKASEYFLRADRKEELQKRISGISATVAIEPLGDEKITSYDVRGLEQTIHTVKALIELQGAP